MNSIASLSISLPLPPADTEDVVNEALRVETIIVSILFVDQGDGLIRVNFRSKPPLTDSGKPARDVDVSVIAAQLGGGGHRRAAGARVRGTLDEAKRQVLQRVEALLAAEK